MNQTIEIVDRGRGPQLSTGRITVQDLVPYFLKNYSYEYILEAIPSLSVAEIQVVERYVEEHYEEVMEQDGRIRERAEARRQPPEAEAAERIARRERLEAARQKIRRQQQERNGANAGR